MVHTQHRTLSKTYLSQGKFRQGWIWLERLGLTPSSLNTQEKAYGDPSNMQDTQADERSHTAIVTLPKDTSSTGRSQAESQSSHTALQAPWEIYTSPGPLLISFFRCV